MDCACYNVTIEASLNQGNATIRFGFLFELHIITASTICFTLVLTSIWIYLLLSFYTRRTNLLHETTIPNSKEKFSDSYRELRSSIRNYDCTCNSLPKDENFSLLPFTRQAHLAFISNGQIRNCISFYVTGILFALIAML